MNWELKGLAGAVHNPNIEVTTADNNTREWSPPGPGGSESEHELMWNPMANGSPKMSEFSRHRVGMADRLTPESQSTTEGSCQVGRVHVTHCHSTGKELFPRGVRNGP